MEKMDVSSARRRLKSPNIKTRKRALKVIKQEKKDNRQRFLKGSVRIVP